MTDSTPVPEIDVHELARRRRDGAAVLDVRQPDEYEKGHVPGAVLIPLDQLPDRLDDVPVGAAGGSLAVICGSGARSRVASELLREHGIESSNVHGGTIAWAEAGFEVEQGAS